MNQAEFVARLKQYNASVLYKTDEKAIFSRQRDEDLYKDLYKHGVVIQPPYDFGFLRSLYEESDILQSSIASMVKNVVGMGYTFNYLGEDKNVAPEDEVDKERILDFFTEVNESDEWTDVLSWSWEDFEITGCMAQEVVRNMMNEIMFIYYHPVENLRKVVADDSDYVEDTIKIRRGGKIITTKTIVFYRRFVALLANGSLRYYKSFGDPRPLRIDGTYSGNAMLASELIWVDNKKGALKYGLPRWIGATFDVAGRRDAQVLNWDALRSQGISPMAILVNGRLTDDSWDEIWNMIMGSKGVENFNKIWVLQVAATPTAVGSQSSADVKIQDLSSAQKTDEMFQNYLKGTEDRIRQTFRVPAGFLGGTGAYSYGTLKVAKLLGEEQVFGPERKRLDNMVNRLILRKGFDIWNWAYKTKAAEVAGPDEIRQAISSMVNAGAMSINNSVKLAGDALGREFSEFDAPWANFPLPLVLKVLDKFGMIDGMEEITGQGPMPPDLLDVTPALQEAPQEIDDGGGGDEGATLELSAKEGSSPFDDRGAVWAAAPRYSLYAYQTLRTMVRDAYAQAFDALTRDAVEVNKGDTIEEMVDRIVEKIASEAVSFLPPKQIQAIFARMYNQIHETARGEVFRQVKSKLRKYEQFEQLPGLPQNWQMDWNLANQEATSYFSKLESSYLSKYIAQGPATNQLRSFLQTHFVDMGASPGDRNALNGIKQLVESPGLLNNLQGRSDSYLKMMIQTGVARAQNYGSLQAMHAMGVKTYKVTGPRDMKTCMLCWNMMDRVGDVSKDLNHWKNSMTYEGNSESHHGIDVVSIVRNYRGQEDLLANTTTAQIQAHIPASPPFHPNCRHTIVVEEFALPEAKVVPPVSPANEQEIIPGITPGNNVSDPIVSPVKIDITHDGVLKFLLDYEKDAQALSERVSKFVPVEYPISDNYFNVKVFRDPNNGDLWMYKSADFFGANNEVAAYKIGQIINPGGRVAVYAGKVVENLGYQEGVFERFIPDSLIESKELSLPKTKKQYEFMLREQIVDKVLGNFDAHSKNFIVLRDGRIIAIDKGGAWERTRFRVKDVSNIDNILPSLTSPDNWSVYYKIHSEMARVFRETGKMPFDVNPAELEDTVNRARRLLDVRYINDGVNKKRNLILEKIFEWRNDPRYAAGVDSSTQLIYKILLPESRRINKDAAYWYSSISGIDYHYKAPKIPRVANASAFVTPSEIVPSSYDVTMGDGVYYNTRTGLLRKEMPSWKDKKEFREWFASKTGYTPPSGWLRNTNIKDIRLMFQDIAPFIDKLHLDWSKIVDIDIVSNKQMADLGASGAGGVFKSNAMSGKGQIYLNNELKRSVTKWASPEEYYKEKIASIKKLAKALRELRRTDGFSPQEIAMRRARREILLENDLKKNTAKVIRRDFTPDVRNFLTTAGTAHNHVSGSFIHEIGHAFHLQNKAKVGDSLGREFYWQRREEVTPYNFVTTTYSIQDTAEAFAEAFSLYVLGHLKAIPRGLALFFERETGIGIKKRLIELRVLKKVPRK